MSSDDTATSTRVFVSGLPPSFTSDDLRKHFAQKFSVTDAHILADRRIGFVGLPDHDAAQNAVKYFNKSFIRMSKISAALARPVGVSRDASGQAAPVSQKQEKFQNAKKRKREQRDDGELQRQSTQATAAKEERTAASSPPANAEPEFEGFGPAHQEKLDEAQELGNEAVSDMDWLRGKTNRTLDLREPGEEASTLNTVHQLPSPVSPERSTNLPASSADDDAEMADDKDTKVVTVPNGRLFVRNLAFSANERDLEELFAAFGKLEEVRFPNFLVTRLSRDDFLIGTSYASHMIRTGSQFFSRCFANLIQTLTRIFSIYFRVPALTISSRISSRTIAHPKAKAWASFNSCSRKMQQRPCRSLMVSHFRVVFFTSCLHQIRKSRNSPTLKSPSYL